MAKQKVETQEGVTLQLNPSEIQLDSNVRFSLIPSKVQMLADDILREGGIMQPVEVSPLPEAVNGFKYRLTFGYYRHAAVSLLNETKGAGMSIPAIVRTTTDAVERISRQIAENTERNDMSPMDTAVSIKQLMDAGKSRAEIREMFSRPSTTGKKGGKPQPASNSWLNIHLSFLEFPKKIQELIHNGTLGVHAAYELGRTSPEKWDAILERAESARAREAQVEEKEEEKYLAAQKKIEEAEQVVQVVEKEFDKVKEVADKDMEALRAAQTKESELYAATKAKHEDAKSKKEAQKAFVEAQKTVLGLEGKVAASAKDLAKFDEKRQKALKLAEEQKAKLAEARAKTKTTKAVITGPDVQKAAAQEGEGRQVLKALEMRKYIADLCLPGTAPKVMAIGQIIRDAFDSKITDKEMYRKLCGVTGEKATSSSRAK